jgi:hypothetical protein
VEGSEVVHLSVTGSEVATYVFDNMDLHDVAVTPDEQRLLGVGTLIRSPGGLNPRMSKEEKRIVGVSPLPPISCRVCLNSNPVYNIKEQVVEK